MRTILATTKELAFLGKWRPDDGNGWAYPGLVNPSPSDTNADLKSTLERLFQNYTISLLAEPLFQPNYSSHFAPPNSTNVSLPIFHNIYTYDRETLWISYGLSIFFTTLAATAGIIAVLLNGASYSNNFSTIVRVARTADLSTEILDKERDGFGRDPLPKYLKHARLNMSGGADGVAAASAAGGANTDEEPLVELVERRPVAEDEQSSIATRTEMDQSRGSVSVEELRSPFMSQRSIGSRSSVGTREMDLSHRDISAEEQQSFFISRRSIESVD
ncbi:MAG: hypothetical protein OHK93_006294 [Ramalina farinacea]|uniref:Transmembrane protein n=1 Tax=Ramalina farinacea TaxID=258253 RepID=A0AA43QL98_9LECA|nr:hypothetical protein [Ramalina farinacea]